MANIRDVDRLGGLLLELGRRRPLRDPLSTRAELELAGPQLHALMWLGSDGPLTMGELAHRLGITEKGVTGVGDRLEEHGYCQRERDTEDRRVVRLQLTGEGEALFQHTRGRVEKKLGFLLDALPAADREALFRILERLADHLARLSSGLPSNVTPISKHSKRSKR